MEQHWEPFSISVEINQGLEPLTLTIIPFEDENFKAIYELNFKVLRDEETLAVLSPDADHCWWLLEGTMEQEQVDAIGAAIDGHST